MKLGRTIVTFYSKPPHVRPIDLLTSLLINNLHMVKALDSIDILDENHSKVGQFLWVSGRKSLIDFLAKRSDYKGPGIPITLHCDDDGIYKVEEGQE